MAAAPPAHLQVVVLDLASTEDLQTVLKRSSERLQGGPLPATQPPSAPPPATTRRVVSRRVSITSPRPPPPLPVPASVVEVYSEWAGPTAACKSFWRKVALEHGGALPCDLSTACLERCGGDGSPLAAHAATSQPAFCLFKGGKEVACVRGVDLPTLARAVAKAEGAAAAAGPRESEAC